jgi:hypothetical protein
MTAKKPNQIRNKNKRRRAETFQSAEDLKPPGGFLVLRSSCIPDGYSIEHRSGVNEVSTIPEN